MSPFRTASYGCACLILFACHSLVAETTSGVSSAQPASSARPSTAPPASSSADLTESSATSTTPSELDLIMRVSPSPIRATLTLKETRVRRAVDLEIHVTLTNEGAEPYPFSTWFLAVATLRLDVRDLNGKHVPSGPPPVPREFDPTERYVIPPSGTLKLEFKGFSYFCIEPDPGFYEVRFWHPSPRADRVDTEVVTEWVRFEVQR